MDKEEILKLIGEVIKTSNSVTTDWLSYCIVKSVDFEVLDEKVAEETKSIKAGIPAVGNVILVDNDFYRYQTDTWKDEYQLLCGDGFRICILLTDDVKLLDETRVVVVTKKVFIKFTDPN